MKTSDVFKLAFRALIDRKLRSVLTILGIMIGAAIILALIASSNGLSAGVQTQIEKIGANTFQIRASTQFFSSGAQSSFQLTQDDLSTIQSIPGVADVIPFYSRAVTMSLGGSSISASLLGVDPNALTKLFKGLSLAEGAFPSQFDPTSAAIGSSIANPPGLSQTLSVDQMISVKMAASNTALSFLVKGVLSPYGSVLFSNIDETIVISLQSAQILLKTQYYSGLYVITNTPDDVAKVQADIQDYYGSNVRVISASAILSSIQSITTQMTVFLGSIGAVSLFVAAVGITNTMFVSVMERTREIGVMKALGYRPRQIMQIFLSEAVLTGAIGAVLGTIFGYFLSFLIGGALPFGNAGGGPSFRFFGSSSGPVFSPELILFSLTFPIGIAVLAGLYPAWRASRMDAVMALKYE